MTHCVQLTLFDLSLYSQQVATVPNPAVLSKELASRVEGEQLMLNLPPKQISISRSVSHLMKEAA